MKVLILDVDGVLINSVNSQGEFLWSKNIVRDLNISHQHLQKIFSSKWMNVIKGKIDTKLYFKRIFKKFDDLKVTSDEFMQY